MSRMVGTVSRGIRAPIIREGDDIKSIVVKSVMEAAAAEKFAIRDRDVVGITEAVVARAQGNYVTTEIIARDVAAKFPGGHIGVIFPILSRNRFAICLRGIAKGAKKVTIMMSYPSDEVGNHLVDMDELDKNNINPSNDVLNEKRYRDLFGFKKHTFTGVDYVEYYTNLIREEGAEAEIIFANDCRTILNYTKDVLCCDIHTRERTKRLLNAAGANTVLGLDNLMTISIDGSGCNPAYGLLGSNKATEATVKLFPTGCEELANEIQEAFKTLTGKTVEVLIYGDGAFKDPVGKIWELADPVVSPGHTSGLEGTPNELKLKYLADNDFANLSGDELKAAISKTIIEKDKNNQSLVGQMATQGTTPRRLTDLIGSLCDLTSGSGDKGTPIIHIQGYFDNYTD